MAVPDVTDADFDSVVLQSSKPVLVDFWAPWCAPCRMISPIIEQIGEEYAEKISVVKLNSDENPATAAKYGITGLPTLAVYSGGEVVRSIVGAKPKPVLLRELEEFIA